jgi:hypothetical protein
MYKKRHRVIEKEKGEFLLKVGIRLFLAIDNETLCKPKLYTIYSLKTEKDYLFPVKRSSLFLLRNWIS